MSMGGEKKATETDDEKDLANIGMQRWQRYQEKWKGVRDQFITDVRDGRDEKRMATSNTGATVASKFDAKRPAVENALATAGGLGSGKFVGGAGKFRTDQARSGAMGLSDTLGAVDTQRLATMESLVSQGQGKAANAITGLADVANTSNQQAIQDAEMAAQDRASMREAVGTAAAIGMSGLSGMGGGTGIDTAGPMDIEAAAGTPLALTPTGDYAFTKPLIPVP